MCYSHTYAEGLTPTYPWVEGKQKHVEGSEKTKQTSSSPSSSGKDEVDIEMLKEAVGAMVLNFSTLDM